jgi:hypothetical protein
MSDMPWDRDNRTILDAPTYPPAASFDPPAFQTYTLKLEDVSLGELLQIPAAWEIVVKHLPALKLAVGSPQLKPQLGNMTVLSMSTFIKAIGSPETLALIDRELAAVPAAKEPG